VKKCPNDARGGDFGWGVYVGEYLNCLGASGGGDQIKRAFGCGGRLGDELVLFFKIPEGAKAEQKKWGQIAKAGAGPQRRSFRNHPERIASKRSTETQGNEPVKGVR